MSVSPDLQSSTIRRNIKVKTYISFEMESFYKYLQKEGVDMALAHGDKQSASTNTSSSRSSGGGYYTSSKKESSSSYKESNKTVRICGKKCVYEIGVHLTLYRTKCRPPSY